MNRIAFQWMVLSGALLAPATTFAQVACTRDGLQAATNLYLAAQGKDIEAKLNAGDKPSKEDEKALVDHVNKFKENFFSK